MSSPLLARSNAVLPFTGATTLVDKEGYGVTLAGDVATLGASATVICKGIVLAGEDTTKPSSIGILGALDGTVRVKLSGAVTRGDYLVQAADGTWVTDPASGGRVQSFIANESGVSGDLIEAVPLRPVSLS